MNLKEGAKFYQFCEVRQTTREIVKHKLPVAFIIVGVQGGSG